MQLLLSVVAFTLLFSSVCCSRSATTGISYPDCPLTGEPKLFANPNGCEKYFSCYKGYAYELSCPIGLLWNDAITACDYAENVECREHTTKVPPITPEMPAIDFDIHASYATYYAAHRTDCSSYYQCQPMRCPSNHYWNNLLQRCVLDNGSTCGPSSTTVRTTTTAIPTAATPTPPTGNFTSTPSGVPDLNELCAVNAPSTYLSYPGDCHKFISCQPYAYIVYCPANLSWNVEVNSCHNQCKL